VRDQIARGERAVGSCRVEVKVDHAR
jgi:hypothetical protein